MVYKSRKEVPEHSGCVAKERLKFMFHTEKKQLGEDIMHQIRQEIGAVITKYVDIEPENIEVRVTLKDYRKRE
jgi:cell division topological specificity factor